MTEERVIWSLAMPACAEVNRTMRELTGVFQFRRAKQGHDIS